LTVLVGDGNDIALEVFQEVIGRIIIQDAADAVLVVVQGDQNVIAPGFTEDFGAIQRVGMLETIDSLGSTDTVGIVGVCVVIKGFELTALLPCQVVLQVGGGVALCLFLV